MCKRLGCRNKSGTTERRLIDYFRRLRHSYGDKHLTPEIKEWGCKKHSLLPDVWIVFLLSWLRIIAKEFIQLAPNVTNSLLNWNTNDSFVYLVSAFIGKSSPRLVNLWYLQNPGRIRKHGAVFTSVTEL